MCRLEYFHQSKSKTLPDSYTQIKIKQIILDCYKADKGFEIFQFQLLLDWLSCESTKTKCLAFDVLFNLSTHGLLMEELKSGPYHARKQGRSLHHLF